MAGTVDCLLNCYPIFFSPNSTAPFLRKKFRNVRCAFSYPRCLARSSQWDIRGGLLVGTGGGIWKCLPP